MVASLAPPSRRDSKETLTPLNEAVTQSRAGLTAGAGFLDQNTAGPHGGIAVSKFDEYQPPVRYSKVIVEVSHVQMMSKKKKTLAVKVEIPRGVSPDPDVSIFMSKPFKLADQ